MIGKKISPILEEVEMALLTFAADENGKTNFTEGGFRASLYIFMTVMMDKMWELQEKETMDLDDRVNMATKLGEDIKSLVKKYVDIDTFELYKKQE